jgi:hypothetical protein
LEANERRVDQIWHGKLRQVTRIVKISWYFDFSGGSDDWQRKHTREGCPYSQITRAVENSTVELVQGLEFDLVDDPDIIIIAASRRLLSKSVFQAGSDKEDGSLEQRLHGVE